MLKDIARDDIIGNSRPKKAVRFGRVNFLEII